MKTLWGAWTGPENYPTQQTKPQQRAMVESRFGASPLPIERVFNGASFALPPPGTGDQVISFDLNPGAVLAGNYDANLTVFARSLSSEHRYWLCLNHECERADKGLDPGEQSAAFDHFDTVIKANRSHPKVRTMPIFMSWSLRTPGLVDQWLPSANHFNTLGMDAYWRPTILNSAELVFRPVVNYAEQLHKNFMICETSLGAQGNLGSMQKDTDVPIPNEKYTQFVTEMHGILNGVARGVNWFEGVNKDGDGRLKDHAEALTAYSSYVRNSA